MSGLPAWRVFNDAEVPCSPLMLRGDEWCRAWGGAGNCLAPAIASLALRISSLYQFKRHCEA